MTCGGDPDAERRAVETLLDGGVDGLILAAARLNDEPALPSLIPRQSTAPHRPAHAPSDGR